MKTALSLIALMASASLLAQDGNAWRTDAHTITGQFGVGWFGLVNDLDITYEDEDGIEYDVTFNGGPATTLAYDYRVGRTFSIGAAYGHQAIKLTNFRRAGGAGGPGERIDGESRIARHFLSARGLFHYGRARNVEFYSGARVGLTLWRVTADGGVEADQIVLLNSDGGDFVLPHLTIIPFGFKGYVGETFYLGAETMFGSPHVIVGQVGVRF